MFRRRPKHVWTVDFDTHGRVSTSNATLAISLLYCRVAELELKTGPQASLVELQQKAVDVLRARCVRAETHASELEKHLVTRTRQLREVELIAQDRLEQLQFLWLTKPERATLERGA